MIEAYYPSPTQGSHHGDTRPIRYAYSDGQQYLPLLLDCKKRWLESASNSCLLTQCAVLPIVTDNNFYLQQKIAV